MTNIRIGYILSRFPVFTETFITLEIEELRRRGIDVQVFSLKRPKRDEALHRNSEELIKTTHYYPYFFSYKIWEGLLFYLQTKPLTCFNIFREIIRTHIKNPVQLLKTIAVLPKTFAIAITLKKIWHYKNSRTLGYYTDNIGMGSREVERNYLYIHGPCLGHIQNRYDARRKNARFK